MERILADTDAFLARKGMSGYHTFRFFVGCNMVWYYPSVRIRTARKLDQAG